MLYADLNAQYLCEKRQVSLVRGRDSIMKEINLPVHAFFLISFEELLLLLLEEIIQNGSETLEVVVGHREATRGADLVDIDKNDASCSVLQVHLVFLNVFIESRCSKFQGAAGKLISTYEDNIIETIRHTLAP